MCQNIKVVTAWSFFIILKNKFFPLLNRAGYIQYRVNFKHTLERIYRKLNLR